VRVQVWAPQPYDTSPGQRFRIEQWEPFLSEAGITLEYSPFMTPELSALLKRRRATLRKAVGVLAALRRRYLEALRAGRFDLVYIFREDAILGPAVPAWIAAARRVPFVFDFDDAVWIRYRSPSNPGFSRLRWPSKTATYCRHARLVLAGNPELQRYAESAGGHAIVVPTTIDTSKYVVPRRPANAPPVIGWTGSFSTEAYLETIRPALEELARRHRFRLVVVGGGAFRLSGAPVEHRPWRADREVEDLSDIDIGVMPLPDNPWERGKCGLKALQYMALGIPPVVSPVGVNSEIVGDGTSGFLAASTTEWVDRLSALLSNDDLRRRIGRAARALVEGEYSAAIHGPRVAHLLREAMANQGHSEENKNAMARRSAPGPEPR
jgi:glycosyltransferase involved in cell wall biosynthesis